VAVEWWDCGWSWILSNSSNGSTAPDPFTTTACISTTCEPTIRIPPFAPHTHKRIQELNYHGPAWRKVEKGNLSSSGQIWRDEMVRAAFNRPYEASTKFHQKIPKLEEGKLCTKSTTGNQGYFGAKGVKWSIRSTSK
jgi:hypothetical protein